MSSRIFIKSNIEVGSMSLREKRLEAMRDIVREGEVQTQVELMERLMSIGYECTKSTVSRDMSAIGVEKDGEDGSLVLTDDAILRRAARGAVRAIDQKDSLLVIHTSPGMGEAMASAIDAAGIHGVLGCFPARDVVLVVLAEARVSKVVCRLLGHGHDRLDEGASLRLGPVRHVKRPRHSGPFE